LHFGCKPNKIKWAERRISRCQLGECRLFGQVRSFFEVSITKAAKAAQQITDAHDAGKAVIAMNIRRCMVAGDDLRQLRWQVPCASNDFPAITVSDSEHVVFGFVQRYAIISGFFVAATKFVRSHPEDRDDSNVVEKSGRIGLRRFRKSDSDCDLAGDHGAGQRMRPEYGWIYAERNCRHKLE